MTLEDIRHEIDRIDREIVQLIAQRQELSVKLAVVKHREGIPIRDEERRQEVLQNAFDRAVEHQIDPVYVQQIMELLITMSEERQRGCSGEGNLP